MYVNVWTIILCWVLPIACFLLHHNLCDVIVNSKWGYQVIKTNIANYRYWICCNNNNITDVNDNNMIILIMIMITWKITTITIHIYIHIYILHPIITQTSVNVLCVYHQERGNNIRTTECKIHRWTQYNIWILFSGKEHHSQFTKKKPSISSWKGGNFEMIWSCFHLIKVIYKNSPMYYNSASLRSVLLI